MLKYIKKESMEEALRQPVRLGRSIGEEGPGPAPLGESTAGQEHSASQLLGYLSLGGHGSEDASSDHQN